MKLKTPIGLVAPARTVFGKLGGGLAGYEPHELLAAAFKHSSRGTPDEVIAGSVRNALGNVARVAALEAGLPLEVPAATVDRQCASSLEALAIAAARIGAGLGSRILVGGVESASRCPWFLEKSARPYAWAEPRPYPIRMSAEEVGDPSMGETAEILADEFDVSREEQDEFAAESQRRAAKAWADGAFEAELAPLPDAPERDESVRDDTNEAKLAKLRPVFRKDGRVTAGNSSPLTDGASACLAASLDALEADGVAPDARLTGLTTVALHPARMGMGPALAIPRLLEACGLKAGDIDLFEINEAFAAQILACQRELKLPPDVLNVHGGAIAIGHPFGATGVRLIATLVNALKRGGGGRGVVSLCIAGGQGMAALIEVE